MKTILLLVLVISMFGCFDTTSLDLPKEMAACKNMCEPNTVVRFTPSANSKVECICGVANQGANK